MLAQWAEVEASFAQHYHLSIHDLFNMSWRRFRVLFQGVFHWKDEDTSMQPDYQSDRLSDQVDWNAPKENLLEKYQGTTIPVGKE